jgi:NAD(P)-dependent dehydrogenase (short-subunit alcohol dehydrogenase family)
VDNFIRKNHPHEEEAIFKKLSNHQPIGRMGKTDEVAALALYLCSDEAGFVTGSSYDIDGGVINLI